MKSNSALAIAELARFAYSKESVRPTLHLAYGIKGGEPQNDNLSSLNRKEIDCCNRATD